MVSFSGKIKNKYQLITNNKYFRSFFVDNIANSSLFAVVAIVLVINLLNGHWKMENKVIGADVKSYYLYLPATFIYQDLSLDYIAENIDRNRDNVWFRATDDGTRFISVTYGMSLLYLPFFLLAHAIALNFGLDTWGYSYIYKFFLILSSVFYFGLGLFYLKRILLKFFNQTATALTLFTVAIGTNALYYVTYEPAMSHIYSFTLLILFIYLTIKWHERPKKTTAVLLGLLSGLIVLVRPTNIIIASIFILWNIGSFKDLSEKARFFIRNYFHILLILISGFAMWIPQMIYWKTYLDNYFFVSYGDRAYFFFLDPEIVNILFSYRKGWLIYTPVMILAIIGIPFLYKKYKGKILPISIFATLNIYVLASWCFWWFGGSFGSRGFIDSYGIMAIPLAAFLSWTFSRKMFIKIPVILITILLIYFNTFQIRQYVRGAIHYVSMTKEAYWETFGKLHTTSDFYEYLEFPDYESVERRILKAKGKLNEEENK